MRFQLLIESCRSVGIPAQISGHRGSVDFGQVRKRSLHGPVGTGVGRRTVAAAQALFFPTTTSLSAAVVYPSGRLRVLRNPELPS